MGLSRMRNNRDKQDKIQTPPPPSPLTNGEKHGVTKSFFGASSDFDMLVWLRGVALDPCSPQATHNSVQQKWNQALKTWKLLSMTNDDCPRRKRKFELFLKGSNLTASSGLSLEKSSNQNAKKVASGQFSSIPCSLNSYDGTTSYNQSITCNSLNSGGVVIIEDNFQGKHENTNFTFSDNAKNLSLSGSNVSPLVDTNELVDGSNSSNPENRIVQDAPLVDPDDSAHNSDSLSSGVYTTPQQAVELLVTTGECPPRPVIPIGPGFQAEIPKWAGSTTKGIICTGDGDSDNLRWMGTKSWPMEGVSRDTNLKAVGKGRPKSCSCASPGSVDCIKRHIREARLLLQSDLGPTFLSWKFDEMGEAVSKSWTLNDQRKFESLVKTNPLSNVADFWECAMKNFPSKGKRSLLNYYYNVYIPQRMSVETRSSNVEVDSDDDQADDSDDDQAEGQGNYRRLKK